jgi:hypothetical protein
MKTAVEYLTHYYLDETGPFRSLSALPDEDAIKIMEAHYDDTLYGLRFKDPAQYLRNRKATESWVREGFVAKGGKPQDDYPIPMVLGSSKWLEENPPERGVGKEIRIPLAVFTESDVSFTYPDSMVSFYFEREKPAEYYQPHLHGVVFTLSEILALVARKGMPEEDWKIKLRSDLAPYIEAQVWSHKALFDYLEKKTEDKG